MVTARGIGCLECFYLSIPSQCNSYRTSLRKAERALSTVRLTCAKLMPRNSFRVSESREISPSCTARLPQSWRPSDKIISTLSSSGRQPNPSQHPWVQFPDIHTTSVLFVKNNFPGGILLLLVTTSPSLIMSKPSAKTTNPLV